ncbi:MAG TPA: TolC family protein [Thermodesulfobacteriota bacterium]|nr:TolC family protein [Thermodesulfobacteriota bacterium]
MHLKTAALTAALFMTLAYYAPAEEYAPLPPSPPEAGEAVRTGTPEPAAGSPITLRQALALALERSPALKAYSLEIRAREARAIQEGLPPNPGIEAFVEDFGGTGSVEGFRGVETTILLSQLVPLSGRISKQKKVAGLDAGLAGWDYEAARLDVLTDTAKAFADLVAAERRLGIMEELAGLSKRVYDTVAEQADAGGISPIQAKRTRVAYSRTEISLGRARREVEAARKALAAKWGSTKADFGKAEGSLDTLLPVPPYEDLAAYIDMNPDVARWAAEMEKREAVLGLEKARAIPEPVVSGGYRRIGENDDNAFVVGLSIPLPIFDRNQGAIAEARRLISKGEHERREAEVNAGASLAAAYAELRSSYEAASLLGQDVVPRAEEAYSSIFEGYREGKFSLLDVLDAQRTVFDTKLEYVNALGAYHRALADVERLTGRPLNEMRAWPEIPTDREGDSK